MILLQYERDIIPKLLPKNGVVAEIGVAEGDFSECILTYNQPINDIHLRYHSNGTRHVSLKASSGNPFRETSLEAITKIV